MRTSACLVAFLALSACSNGAQGSASIPNEDVARALTGDSGSGKISHVVIIVQENRSFDNLFQAYPGADTQPYGYASTGQKVTLVPIGLSIAWDIDHSSKAYFAACDGQGKLPGTKCRMDGFDKETVSCGRPWPPCPNPTPQYAYAPQSETKPYFSMAQQYVLADKTFASDFDASSFVAHQYLIAAQASSSVDFPLTSWGCDGGKKDTVNTITQQRTYGPPIVACFDNQTLGDELDAAGLPWRYYTSKLSSAEGGLWSAYQAIKHIRYGPDWKSDVITPQTRFLKDVAAGKLAAVTWIAPTCRDSDHAGCDANRGPSWVTSLVNAVGKSQFWSSTAIFVLWDDYGGWYDHVPPPTTDYDGLGMRVPMLVISPYAKKGYVSHVRYEFGSILKFTEDQFGLTRLAASDTRATSPAHDCFDFSQPPRAFVPIQSPLHAADFEHERLDPRPPDNE